MTSIGRPEASKRKIFGPRHNSSGSVRAATQKKLKKNYIVRLLTTMGKLKQSQVQKAKEEANLMSEL